jgi:hypothetical protein
MAGAWAMMPVAPQKAKPAFIHRPSPLSAHKNCGAGDARRHANDIQKNRNLI